MRGRGESLGEWISWFHHSPFSKSVCSISHNRSTLLAIMELHDFLVEHAKFPFPHTDGNRRVGTTTDISQFEIGLLEREWKAGHAVRDDTLVQKLCRTLEDILGDTHLAASAENYILARFLLQVDDGGKDKQWDRNSSEPQVSI